MSAIISQCGTFRYRLERGPFDQVGQLELADDGVYEFRGKVIAFFGVNPSTADASLNDQTVNKWIGFCRRWGARRFIVGNVFAYRSTDVKGLTHASDPNGPDNPMHIKQIIEDADILVPCWGDRAKLDRRLQANFDWIKARMWLSGKPIMTFGFTKGGDPKHPLMLGYDTPLIEWPRTKAA